MLLLISDANILIDMEAGKLLEKLFLLPFNFAIPDILYWEEIQPEAQAGFHAVAIKHFDWHQGQRIHCLSAGRAPCTQ